MASQVTRVLSDRRLRSAVLLSMLASQWASGLALARQTVTAPTSADPLLIRVPADALVYASFAGTDSATYQSSKLAKVAGSAEVSKLLDTLIPEAVTKLADPATVEQYKKILSVLRAFAARPLAFCIVPQRGNFSAEPDVFGLVDGGERADEVQAKLVKALEGAGAPVANFKVARDGNILILKSRDAAELSSAPGTSLLSNPQFTEATAVAKRPGIATDFVSVFVDIKTFMKLVEQEAAGKADAATFRPTMDASGIMGVKSFYLAGRFDQTGEYLSEAAIIAPSPRTGIVGSIFTPRAGPSSLTSRVPADAVAFQTLELNVPDLIDRVVDTLDAAQPGLRDRVPGVWGMATAATGVRVREDLLEAMGPEWLVFQSGTEGSSLVMVNKANDAAKVGLSLTNLLRAGQRFALMAAKNNPNPPKLELTVTDVAGTKVTTVSVTTGDAAIPPNVAEMLKKSLSFAVKDGLVFLSGDPQSLRAALVAPEKDITTAPAYKAMVNRMGVPANSGFGLFDLPRSVKMTKDTARQVLTQPDVQAAMNGIDLLPMVDAMLDAVTAHLAVAGEARWIDDQGFHARSISPFPGAELFSSGATTQYAVGGVALGVSILLPSLNRARETANRIKSASNLRQVGQACQFYANENKGKYPEDLGQILLTQDVTILIFTSPRTNTTIPREVMGAGPQEMALWVTTNSDYAFFGKGLTADTTGDVVVAHERLDRGLSDGINVLFADGRVEFVTMKQLPAVMEASKAARGN